MQNAFPHLSGGEALTRLLNYRGVKTILDIGSGGGFHAKAMRLHDKDVTTISMTPHADYIGDYNTACFPESFDAIWASHVLEHQPNPNLFLRKCLVDLKPGGILAVTVPPMKPELVGGHTTMFNQGILLYNLILAGFNCINARVSPLYASGFLNIDEPYNISILVEKAPIYKLPPLLHDAGDLETLARYFPYPIDQGMDGRSITASWL